MFSLKLLPINHQHHNTQNQKYGQHHQHTHVKTFVFCFQYIEIGLVINQRYRNHGKYQKHADHSTNNSSAGFRETIGSIRNYLFLHKVSLSALYPYNIFLFPHQVCSDYNIFLFSCEAFIKNTLKIAAIHSIIFD